MYKKLALSILMDLNLQLEEHCHMDITDFDEDFLEGLIECPDDHLITNQTKFNDLVSKVSDKHTKGVYYGFYIQGQIDGILELFRLKSYLEDEKNEKH